MNSIVADIKNAYSDNRNPVIKYIVINSIIFLIIAFSSIVFFLFNSANIISEFILNYFTIPAAIPSLIRRPWSIISYQFLHEKVFHLLFNMMVLYWFGNLLVEYLGKIKFIFAYWVGGIAGGFLYVLFFNLFPIFESSLATSRALGASASIMAIVFATATLLPNYTIVLAIFGPIRLKYIALFYFVFDLIGINSGNAGGHIAHLGGGLLGFIFIKQLQSGNDWAEKLNQILKPLYSLFTANKNIKIVHKANKNSNSFQSDTSQEQIDQILEKITKSGYDSLSKEEKQNLFKASNK